MYDITTPNKNDISLCKSCCLGKSHRLPAPASYTAYTQPFELIHSDLWGPSPSPSLSGYSYYIAFVDTFTKFTWLYF